MLRNPQDRQAKSVTSVQLMQDEHNLRKKIDTPLDKAKRQQKLLDIQDEGDDE